MQNRTKQVLATAVAACALFTLARRAAAAPISYTGGDYIQGFNSLSNVNGNTPYSPTPGPFDVPTADGGTLTGWSFARLAGTNTSINFQVDDGSSVDKGQVTSAGANGSTDRALSSVATTASTPNFGFQITNNTTDTFNSFTLTYTGEQWRRQTAPANSGFLAFSYSTSATNILTGSFSSAAQLNFVSPNGSGTPGALNGNAPGNNALITATVSGFVWNPGQTLTLRWNDFNESGDDDWLGIDDLTFTGKKAPVLKWNTANLTGLWNTNIANKPWLDETLAPSHFIPTRVAELPNTSNDIEITVDAAGVAPALTLVTNSSHKYTLVGGPVNGPLNKSSAGALVLKSPNNFNSISIDTGTIETQIDGAFPNIAINLSNGGTWKTSTVAQNSGAANTINITGTGRIYTDSDLTLNAAFTGGNAIFIKDGPGLLWGKLNFPLTGNSEIHVDGGTLRDSDLTTSTDGIPDSVILRIAAGATFDESFGNGEQFSALSGDGTYLGHRVANGSGHINFLNNTATTFVFNGLITAGTNGVVGASIDEREILALRKNGIHTAVLTNPLNDFAGQVQVNNGVLEIPLLPNRGEMSPIGMGNIASAPATPGADITFGTQGLAVDTAGTLRYTGPSGSSDRTINLNAGSGVIEISNPAAALTLAGPITGGNNTPFQKTGPGTLILTGDNTFGGGMDVVAGKLLVNNTTGSGAGFGLLSVKEGATLGGTGTIQTNVYIQTGGTLAPGDSIGTLSANATTIDPDAKLHWELNSTDGSADLYNVTGSFDLLGQATIDFDDLGAPSAKTFTLIKYTGAVSNFANLLIGTTPNPSLTYTLVDNQANQSIDLTVTGSSIPPQWNLDANGSWGVSANWIGGIPNAPGATANFLGVITAPRTITLDGDKTVGTLNFDNANKYTIAQGSGGTLTISGSAINVAANRTAEISAPLSLASDTNITAANGGTLILSGPMSIAAGKSATKNGPGTLTISGVQSHGAGTSVNINNGRANLNSNLGSAASAGSAANHPTALNISASGGGGGAGDASVVTGADQNLAELTIPTANAGVQSLDLATPAAPGQFRSIHVYASNLATAKTALYNAIKNAITTPGDGIFDSGLTPTTHTSSKLGLAQVADAHGDVNIFIRPTRIGDLNLDGQVTISDFIDLASNFNGTGKTWQEGDLNYDGNVTISDFIDLASNFGGTYAGQTFPISPSDAQLLSNFAAAHSASVPEPTTLTLAALSCTALLPRRRRHP
jgi:autotransporter-associated beta strand protein